MVALRRSACREFRAGRARGRRAGGGVEGGRYDAWKFLKNESGSEPLARARARGSR